MKLYYVYMLFCVDGTYYVGVTNNPERRLWEHNSGAIEGCYTHDRRPLILTHVSEFGEVMDAIAWEKRLKAWSHAKKRALANGDWAGIRKVVRDERRRREKRS